MLWFHFLDDLKIHQSTVWTGMNTIDAKDWLETSKLYNVGEGVTAHLHLKFNSSESLKTLLIRMLVNERSWNLIPRAVIQFRLPKMCSWNSELLPWYSNTHWCFCTFGFYSTFLLQKYQKKKKSNRPCKSTGHTVIPVTRCACLKCQEIQINKIFT